MSMISNLRTGLLGGGQHVTVRRPRRGMVTFDLAKLWRFRDLWLALAIRDFQVRYKQSLIGAGWALLQPIVAMVVFHFFFGRLMGMTEHVNGAPYPVFLYAGLLPWTLFSSGLTATSKSMVANAHILTKASFPRLILPLSAVAVPIVDYFLAFGVLLALMLWYGVPIGTSMLLIPVTVFATTIAVLAVGVALAAMTAVYRDVGLAVPFMIQLGFFATPVVYPLTFVWHPLGQLLVLNPMAGPIDLSRAVVLGNPIDWTAVGMSMLASCVLLAVSLCWFNMAERRMADVI